MKYTARTYKFRFKMPARLWNTPRRNSKYRSRKISKPVQRTLFFIYFILSFSSCSLVQSIRQPDLGGLYNRAAMEGDRERNPVVVLPGVLGSKLKSQTSGQRVWGAFFGGYASPSSAEGAHLIAHPIAEGVPLSQLKDEVVPDGALDSLRINFLGLPVELGAYAHILHSLGAGGYRDQQLGESGAIDYGSEHFTCFQFDYDWRRDLVETAKILDAFLKEKHAYVKEEFKKRFGIENKKIKFDVVAHSMGGLVVRYYLRYGTQELPSDGSMPKLTWEGRKLIDRAILIGTPNAGSIQALIELVEGAKFAPIFPRYSAALLGTMPAIYQLLPRARHGLVVQADSGETIDRLLDPKFWQKMKWGLANPAGDSELKKLLPDIKSKKERLRIAQEHQAKCLNRAEQFTRAIDLPAKLPEELSLHLIAGDAEQTPAKVSVNLSNGKLEILEYAPGDATVLRASALMDERQGREWTPRLVSPIDWSQVMFLFSDHLAMTKDPVFTDNILYSLLEMPR